MVPRRPDPEWTATAGDLGLKLASNTAGSGDEFASSFRRQQAMGLYARALGPKAASGIEAMVQNDDLEPGLRAAAESQLVAFVPDTAIVPALAAKYDGLPVPLRESLGTVLCRARTTPGAAAFVVRFLKDLNMGWHRQAVTMLDLPATPELVEAVYSLSSSPSSRPRARST